MSGKALLRVVQGSSQHRSPLHERFEYLLARIDEVRRAKAELEACMLAFRRADAQQLLPLRLKLRALMRETLFALDELLSQPGWSRVEQAELRELLCATARLLLEGDPKDHDARALHDKHSRVGFDTAQKAELEELKRRAEEMGFDFGEEEISSEDDLVERIYAQVNAREEAAQAHRRGRSERRGPSAAQQRATAGAQAAKRLLRELYRKLASAVHPDREADARRRIEKNELMQKINRAYAAQDLHTLLEAHMHLEQIDPAHVARLSGERLKHYNKLLAEQLHAAEAELGRLQKEFRTGEGVQPSVPLTRRGLMQVFRRRMRDASAHVERQELLLNVLADRGATKRWLKEQRWMSARWDFD